MVAPTLPDDAVVDSNVCFVLDEVLQHVTLEDAFHLLLMQLRLHLFTLVTLQCAHQPLPTSQPQHQQTIPCDLLTLTFDFKHSLLVTCDYLFLTLLVFLITEQTDGQTTASSCLSVSLFHDVTSTAYSLEFCRKLKALKESHLFQQQYLDIIL